jgi:hypothetical protein
VCVVRSKKSESRGAVVNNVKSEVALIAESLQDGATHRGDCPACGRKSTFTVTRTGLNIVYNCYSTHCLCAGYIGSGRRLNLEVKNERKQSFTPFNGELQGLTSSQFRFLSTRIGWDQWHVALGKPMYAPAEDRFAFPIFGPMGIRRGWILRSYDASCPPRWKALTRMDVAEPHMSWYRSDPSDTRCLVVEDIPSAVRAVRYWPNVVAINGGGIGPSYVQEITAHNGRSITWALDGDATNTALKLHRKYSLFFDSSNVLVLNEDIKDLDEGELAQLAKGELGEYVK